MSATAEVIDLTKSLPTTVEIDNASEASRALAQAVRAGGGLRFSAGDGPEFTLAAPIARLLAQMVDYVADGKMVKVLPLDALLTSQQAADLLNVSRPFLSGLLKAGEIPFVPVGSHRKVKLADVLAYRERRDAQRDAAINDLIAAGEAFDNS